MKKLILFFALVFSPVAFAETASVTTVPVANDRNQVNTENTQTVQGEQYEATEAPAKKSKKHAHPKASPSPTASAVAAPAKK